MVERSHHSPVFVDTAVAEAERRQICVRRAVGSPHPFGPFEVVCDLLHIDPASPEAEHIRSAGTTLAALRSLAEAVDRLCIAGPHLLVVDRADQVDASTARFLRYLTDHLEARSASLLLVAGQVASGSWLEELGSDGAALRLRSADGVAAPRLTRARIEELGAAGDAVVAALAVLGPGGSLAAISAVSEQPTEVVFEALDRLQAWDLLQRTPRGAGHLLVTDAVLDAMVPTRRAELHQRAAVHGRGIGESAMRLATHLEHTPPGALPWAAAMLRAAAALAQQFDDPEGAVRFLQRAIEEDQIRGGEVPVRTLLELARAQGRASDPGATATLRLAAERASGAERPGLKLRFARQLALTGQLAEAVEVFDTILAGLDPANPAHAELRLQARVGLVTACRSSLELRARSAELLAELSDELTLIGSDEPDVLAELAYEHALSGTHRRIVLDLCHRATAAMAHRPLSPISAQALFLSLVWAEDLGAASLLCDQLHEGNRDQPLAAHRRGTVALAGDEVDLAVTCSRKAVADIEWVAPMLVPGARAQLARALVRRHDFDGAEAALRLPSGEGRWRHHTTYHPVLLAKAELAAARGAWSEAAAYSEACGRFSREMGTLNPAVVPWHVVSARALAELGRRHDAEAALAQAAERAAAFGAAGPIALIERTLAEIRTVDPLVPGRSWEVPPVPVLAAEAGSYARRLRLLGDTVLALDGEEHRLGDDLAGRAVCIIGLAPGGIHDEQLVEALWPDGDPAVGRNRLRNVLMRIRQRYGRIVQRRGRTIALVDDVVVDVHEFCRLADEALTSADARRAERAGRGALELHRGELCPVYLFEPWAAGPRTTIRQRWLSVLDHLAILLADRGDVAGSLALTEVALTADRWVEERYVDAAERLAAADRPGAARSILRRCERMCAELGVAPSARQRALAAALR